MADRVKGITIQIGGDVSGLSKALEGVNKKISSTQDSLKDVQRLLKLDPKNTELLAQKQRYLAENVKGTADKLQQLKSAQKEVNEQFKASKITQEVYDNFNRELAETEQRLKSAKQAAKDFGNVASQEFKLAAQDLEKVGDKISGAGKALAPLTGGVVAVGTAAMAAWSELDAGYDTIVTKTGATGEALASLQDSMDAVFASIPTDAETAGVAIGEVNTRFGATGDTLEALSRQFIEFAEINGTDLNNAIDSVDAIMTKYGVDSSHTAEVLGLMTKAGQDTGRSMDTLQNALNTNGATLKEMGLGLTESINLLAEFEANGVDTTQALAGLKKAQQNATADGKTLGDALGETITKIKDAKTETDALQIATDLFGKKGAAEMTQAIREGRLSVEDLSASLGDYATTVEDTFNATLDPPDKAKVALNNLKLAGSDLASTMLDMVAPMIDKIVEGVRDLVSWLDSLDDDQKQMIITVAGIVAAIGPALVILGKVVSGIGQVTNALGMLIANPIPALIALIVALVALVAVKGDEMQAKLQEFDDFLQDIFAADWTEVFGPVLGDALNAFFAVVKFVWGHVKSVLDGIIDFIRGIFTGDWQRVWKGVVEIFEGIFGGIAEKAKIPLNALLGLVNSVISGINGVTGLLNKIPGVNIGQIGKIPYLAKGGVVTRGQAIVGEAGPELLTVADGRTMVQPLTNNTTNNNNLGGITVNVYGAPGQDIRELAELVGDAVQSKIQQRGAVWA